MKFYIHQLHLHHLLKLLLILHPLLLNNLHQMEHSVSIVQLFYNCIDIVVTRRRVRLNMDLLRIVLR
ncbi:MAG: hypothetical protein EBR73_17570 [Rhodobacteraceae bacterium]|nr:hypothetical protein [Paracoccaceae bacterium]